VILGSYIFVVQRHRSFWRIFRSGAMAPTGVLTHVLRWETGRASFKTVRGSVIGPGAATVSEHIFTSGVPTPEKETVHMGLYSYRHAKSSSQQPVEVVIEKFQFLP
jgi:hypothetical protein